ncbi:hypothetical protein N0V83_006297 [Neocucurbitaria cava]|uniref:C2H2-type domain-containing protein n=1 Tax=Neocucurbitaria cava TaxID=798079 RepID=A0A9W9CM32_9PLEO|nr:hypothetical protein N0V83_006297 [Neocucurbitaria cava]
MARPKRSLHHCGMCGQSFKTRMELDDHIANHAENGPATLSCPVCKWPFPDSLALEQHQIQNEHGTPQFPCESCGKAFRSQHTLEFHLKPPSPCVKQFTAAQAVQTSNERTDAPPSTNEQSAQAITCDRCPKIFGSQREYNAHRSFPDGECADHKKRTPPKKRPKAATSGYVDPDQSQQSVNDVLKYDDLSDSPDDLSESDEYCHDCKEVFKSKARFNAHALRCSMLSSSGVFASSSKSFEVRQSRAASAQQQATVDAFVTVSEGSKSIPEPRPLLQARSSTPSLNQPSSGTSAASLFRCNAKDCGKTCRSEAGLKVHKSDVHGIGGKPLDLGGKDSYILNPRMRDQLRAQGLLRTPSTGSSRARGRGEERQAASSPLRRPAPTPPQAGPSRAGGVAPLPSGILPPPFAGMLAPGPTAPAFDNNGVAEMEQAKHIHGKIMRLLIQSDIYIHHDGKMTVCGIGWKRIGLAKQPEVIDLFDKMCHLPKMLQGEYLPAPTTFKDEYKISYPVNDFAASPARDPSKPGLGVVAISCSKILLANGLQEVVKVAAIDLVTCRIVMNHLICTDPGAQVSDWRSPVTGLSSWKDMEAAREAGYKIFKGWSVARSALWKFIDKETIIVGYNLRSDLDTLRMVHGRAVDVAKVVEKAAKGPLSKMQLSLDSLSRDYPKKELKSDAKFGRDCLMNAFAARELGLWIVKHRDAFEKDAKQKSLDYQTVMPMVATAT